MDPISAVGIAGSIVQFLEFGQGLVSTSFEIYKAANGASVSHQESENLLKHFVESINVISADLKQYDNKLSLTVEKALSSCGLHGILEDCRALASELLERYDKLKIHERSGRLKSLMRAVKCMWKESELRDLQARLLRYHSQLEWRLLLSLREDIHLLANRQEDQFVKMYSSITTALTDEIRAQWSNLPHWQVSVPAEIEAFSSRLKICDLSGLEDGLPTKALRIEEGATATLSKTNSMSETIIHDTAHSLASKLAELELGVLESLKFSVMRDREDQITDAELNTFDWIFRNPRNEDRPWSNFSEWLQSGNGIYWINGKAGSGKSTLMKHLFYHNRTTRSLRTWAGELPLVKASFFFWYSGDDFQKSQIGLIRSLLYQCLENHRELIPLVLSESTNVPISDLADHWTFQRLTRAFTRLVQQKICPVKICIFVDGLDEYHGDSTKIAELFKTVAESEYVKLCISSRPLLVFEKSFQNSPSLSLQNLTFDDINLYVRNRLSVNDRMRELEDEEPGIGSRLTLEILDKASGVFLWVKLVINSLLEGLGNYDRGEDLERRLRELPNDLEDLYWHMIERVKPTWYLEESFRLLSLVKASESTPILLRVCFAEIQDDSYAVRCGRNELSQARLESMCRATEGRIKSRCLGSIEILPSFYSIQAQSVVLFLHKSVTDFLETPEVKLRSSTILRGRKSNTYTQLMRAIILELKHIQITEHYQSRRDWFMHVKPLIYEFMEYARHAETVSKKPEVELLDELDRIATELWDIVCFKTLNEHLIHWSIAMQRKRVDWHLPSLPSCDTPTAILSDNKTSIHVTGEDKSLAFMTFASCNGLKLYEGKG